MVAHEVFFRGAEEVRFLADALADELVQIGHGRHVLDPVCVENKQRLLQIVRPPAADPGKRILQLFAELRILREEALRDMRALFHKRTSDEELSGFLHVDAAVIHEPSPDFQPVNEHALHGEYASRFRAPVRIGIAMAAKMRADFLDPLRRDSGRRAREKLRCFHNLRCDEPRGLPDFVGLLFRSGALLRFVATLVKIRAGEERNDAVASGFVGVLLGPLSNVAEQSGEHGAVDCCVMLIGLERLLLLACVDDVGELPVNVAPLAHPGEREEVRLAETAQRIAAAAALGIRRVVPDVEQRKEVGVRIRERLVRRSCGFLLIFGTLARIGHAQPRSDDEHLREHAFLPRLQEHSPKRRIDGKSREFVADAREFVCVVNRAEFVEQRVSRADRSGVRRIDERKRIDVAKPERLHPQNHLREIRALDFRLRECVALVVVVLCVKSDADAFSDTPRAACALVCAALRNLLHR